MKNLSMLFLVAGMVIVAGCDLSSVDPGGGWVSSTTVTLKSTDTSTGGGGGECVDGDCDGPPPEVEGEGAFAGRIVFNGATPSLAPLVGKGTSQVDPTVCAKDVDIPDESLVVSSNGGVANAFVYLDRAPKGVNYDLPAESPLLDQKICIFLPHALIVRAGQSLHFKNSDQVLHNVKTAPGRNQAANESMAPGAELDMVFKAAERAPFSSECAIHPWMRFWTLVIDHPYAAVTDAEGKFQIPNLPAGQHTFKIWHERASGGLLERSLKVTVKPGETHTQDFKYDAAAFGLAG